MSQPQEYDFNSKDFTERQLVQFSPFRVVEIKAENSTSKAGKNYVRYRVSVTPLQNPSVKIAVYMFKQSLDTIRAILILNPKASIQAINAPVTGTNRTVTLYSGATSPSL